MNNRILKHTWTLATLIGVVGGFCAVAYYYLLKASLFFFWNFLYGHSWQSLFWQRHAGYGVILVTSFGGFLVGLTIHFFGRPGEIAAVVDNIHVQHGRLNIKETPSMILNSLVSIGAGGSAGPEAPLVQIIGSLASYMGDKLKLVDEQVRQCTFCGMACALGAFFGAPIGGALFALEIPHRRSIEYGEAIIPSIISAVVGFLIYRSIVGYDGPLFHAKPLNLFSMSYFLYAFLLAVGGSLVASGFIFLFKVIGFMAHPFSRYPILAGVLGGAFLGLLALHAPQILFWGEWQIADLLRSGFSAFSTTQLLWIALGKMVAIALTLHFGFRGGFIFPLFFIGAVLGVLISHIFPMIPITLAMFSLMTALNVAVTKTPLATVVILISLSGSDLFPYLALVSVVSLVFSSKIGLINTQKTKQLSYA